MPSKNQIIIRGARTHNLKDISLVIPKNKFVVITGVSGSGKSSLAFDTIYAEGQRRYAESLSSYARQILGAADKPDVDQIEGLSPTIAIDQRAVSHNPRSTVGTVTEIYDYFRLLYSRIGHPYCPECGKELEKQNFDQIVKKIFHLPYGKVIKILAPVINKKQAIKRNILEKLKKNNFEEVFLDKKLLSIDEAIQKKIDSVFGHLLEAVTGTFYIPRAMDQESEKARLFEEIKKALDLGNGKIVIYRADNQERIIFSQNFICSQCGFTQEKLDLKNFSFNSPAGACSFCSGLAVRLEFIPELIIPNPRLTLAEGAIQPLIKIAGGSGEELKLLSKKAGISLHKPLEKFNQKQLNLLLYGERDKFQGIIAFLEKKHKETSSDYIRHSLENYMRSEICPFCQGKRLKKDSLSVLVGGKSIADLAWMQVSQALEFLEKLSQGKDLLSERERKIGKQIFKEARDRLNHLVNVGLSYITLDRSTMSLSGGENQRIRLASQIGSALTGIIFVFDEPSIGLHPRDNTHLIHTLKRLRDIGNTVIVVEHDAAAMEAADYLIDIGPGAGKYGGEVIAAGSPFLLKKNKKSLTASYLSGRLKIEGPKHYRQGNGKSLIIKKASEFNLKNIDGEIPLGKLICVTGVSGSGKSTLVTEILSKALSQKFYRAKEMPGKHERIEGIENIDKVITIDQSPIGRTPRSNPATYTGLFSYIRDLFAEIPEAKIRGYDAGKFSFNVKGGGRCEACAGDGAVRIEMQFLPDVYVECEECRGKRYHPEVLEIYWQGKNISQVLEMTVEEARDFFQQIPALYEKLSVLYTVGLGYLTLGQSAPTLSGGEAQRVKLAAELSRRDTGNTLYILDEPTTGLHFDDIKRLLLVLNKLVDKGNTVLIIEHNLDVIKCADWVIDLGPEGGEAGGYIVAEGTPEEIVKSKKSYTGQYLKRIDMI